MVNCPVIDADGHVLEKERYIRKYLETILRGRESFLGEPVPEGIPPAVPWDQLEKKRKIPAKVKSIRGKLNVLRERFHLASDGRYRWAGKL